MLIKGVSNVLLFLALSCLAFLTQQGTQGDEESISNA